MNTLCKGDIEIILEHLGNAERHASHMLPLADQDARNVWLCAVRDDIACVRRRLLGASLTDVAIESALESTE